MRRSFLLAVLLLVLAASLRLWAAEHARFTGDESDYWATARRIATGEIARVYGQPITGTVARFPGPGCYYLMAAPQLFDASPRAGSSFVVGLHLLAGLLLFLLGSAARSTRAGLFALAVFVAAPWDVLYGDRIWLSCVIPALGALGLYAAHRARDSKSWLSFLVFLCLVLPQFHLSAPVLWGACLALLALRPPARFSKSALAIGMGLAALTYAPTLVAEIGSDFQNTKAIFAKSGGSEPWSYALLNPLRVLGYMVLYGSGEIGYHFARGYWGGGFDNAAAYFTLDGWRRFMGHHGSLIGGLGITGLILSALAWTVGSWTTARQLFMATRSKRRDPIDLEHALIAALLVGFLGGGVLLAVAKKTFFPHYANILMPMALWPLAALLDRIWNRSKALASGLLVASVTFMITSTVRYYREIDSLNGLANTLDMVEEVLDDGAPSRVEFTHFRNDYAWKMVASVQHGAQLPTARDSHVRWRVHNRRAFEGPLPPGGRRFGSVLLQRVPPNGDGAPRGSKTVRGWRQFRIEAEYPSGRRRPCVRAEHLCRYGDQPWQRFGPEAMQVAGEQSTLLFMHPVQNGVVRATVPFPPGTSAVEITYALSDSACASRNQTPVQLTVLDEDTPLGQILVTNRRGLHRQSFTRMSTQGGALTLELRTSDEGARIFGFDLEFR